FEENAESAIRIQARVPRGGEGKIALQGSPRCRDAVRGVEDHASGVDAVIGGGVNDAGGAVRRDAVDRAAVEVAGDVVPEFSAVRGAVELVTGDRQCSLWIGRIDPEAADDRSAFEGRGREGPVSADGEDTSIRGTGVDQISTLGGGGGREAILRGERRPQLGFGGNAISQGPFARGDGSQAGGNGDIAGQERIGQNDRSLGGKHAGVEVGKIFVQTLPGKAAIERAPDARLIGSDNIERIDGRNREGGKAAADDGLAVEAGQIGPGAAVIGTEKTVASDGIAAAAGDELNAG